MDRKVLSVVCDWFFSNDCGEEYRKYSVGEHGVTEIQYHKPQGDGDRHYCDIYLENGQIIRQFNINEIEFAAVGGAPHA